MEQIILQPDGKFCIYSTLDKTIKICNATESEIIQYFVDKYMKALKAIQSRTADLINAVKHEPMPYYQFTVSYSSMCEEVIHLHGLDYLLKKNLKQP